MLKALTEYGIPAEERYRLPVACIARVVLPLGVLALLLWDMFAQHRYVEYNGGTVYLQPSIRASRWYNNYASIPKDQLPGYCRSEGYSTNVQDPFFQAIAGRMCTTNYTCEPWFDDNDIFQATTNMWHITTAFNPRPFPPAPSGPMDFDTVFAAMPSVPNLTQLPLEEQYAWARENIWGDIFDYTCDPAVFVVDPLNISLTVLVGVTLTDQEDPAVREQMYPETAVYDVNGDLLERHSKGQVPHLAMGKMLRIDLAEVVPTPSLGMPFGKSPVFRARMVGLVAQLDFTITNVVNGRIQKDVVCEVRPTVFHDAMGVRPKFEQVPMTNRTTGKTGLGWFMRAGIPMTINTHIHYAVPSFSSIYLFSVSILVLVSRSTFIIEFPLALFRDKLTKWRILQDSAKAVDADS